MHVRLVLLDVAVAAVLATFIAPSAGLEAQTRDPRPAPTTRASPRDRVPVPQVGSAAITGRVVDGVTGRPVPRARVRLQGGPVGSKGPVLTDGDGMFVFEALPQGSYSVYVEKVTYLPTRHPEPGRSLRNRLQSLTVRNKEALDVTVPMFAGSAIAGRIVDAHGDPVDNASVTVFVIQRNGRPQPRGGGMSNDLGEFRIPRLPPGRYFLRVGPQPLHQTGPGAEQAVLPQPLPTYFPNSGGLEQAQPIVLSRGETVSGVEVVLTEGTPSDVRGVVVASDGQPFAGGHVSARMAGTQHFGGGEHGAGVQPDGSFRFQLPPGEFVLVARINSRSVSNQPAKPADEQFGTVRLTVPGGTVESVNILVGRGATASGRVVFEVSTPAPPPPAPGTARVPMFNPDDPTCRSGEAAIGPDWTFKIEGLIGTCMALPQSMFGRWTVKAVTFRGQNVIDRPFTFEQGQHYGNVQVVVTDRRTQVDVRVTDDLGEPTRDYVALAFPADKERWTQLARYVRTFSPQEIPANITGRVVPLAPPAGAPPGSGDIVGVVRGATMVQYQGPPPRFTGLPPGEYYLIALDDMELEDSQDPAVLDRLIASATKVIVSDDAPLEVPLRRIPFASGVR